MATVTDIIVRQELLSRRARLAAAAGQGSYLGELLREVDEALARLDGGTYGLCDVCHEPVEADRLLADPLVRLCIDHLNEPQRRALERDLELAASIQAAMLPPRHLAFGGWEIFYRYEPMRLVSGDYLDLVQAPAADGSLHFFFGDVAGKGVAASLLMSNLQALFRTLITLDLPAAELVSRANRLFCESTLSTSYATLVAGRLDATGEVELCNAGHLPPLVARDGDVHPLPATGLPLGLFCDAVFRSHRLRLAENDALLLYTDGLSEARSPAGEEYGIGRLGPVLQRVRGLPAEAVVGACLEDLAAFAPGVQRSDDLSAMVIRRGAAAGAAASQAA